MENSVINIYCDESHPMQNDGQDFMVLGALICEKNKYRNIKKGIQVLKRKHGVTLDYEFKWQKVCKKRLQLYLDLIDYIISTDEIRIKINFSLGKRELVFEKYEGYNYETWYHKNYLNMLKNYIETHKDICDGKTFKLYIDKKDTHSQSNYENIAKKLKQKFRKTNSKHMFTAQACDSREFLLIQCIDVIIGSVSYFHKKMYANKYKTTLMKHIMQQLNIDFMHNTPKNNEKVSFYVWIPKVEV
jgi:NADPH-dependent 7-cyano-7-deazaguanine reductase QueF-like protein